MRWTKYHFEIKESIISLLCKPAFLNTANTTILNTRKQIEEIIERYPDFKNTHVPFQLPEDSSSLMKKMCLESQKVKVGPMASVAGVVADECLNTIIAAGAKEAVVDNGGDIALFIHKPLTVGIYAGDLFPIKLAFEISPRSNPVGICTSSGTVGHSFSYGTADAAIVISENIILADAAATALANRIHSSKDLTSCFEIFNNLSEIEGSLVIAGDKISMWGKLPPLIHTKEAKHLITRGKGHNV